MASKLGPHREALNACIVSQRDVTPPPPPTDWQERALKAEAEVERLAGLMAEIETFGGCCMDYVAEIIRLAKRRKTLNEEIMPRLRP